MVNMRKEFGADRRAMLLMRREREMISKNLTPEQLTANANFLNPTTGGPAAIDEMGMPLTPNAPAQATGAPTQTQPVRPPAPAVPVTTPTPAAPTPAAPAPQNQGFGGGQNFYMGGAPGAPAPAPAPAGGGGGGVSNDPQTMARQAQVANATAQSQKKGGIGMNPWLNVAGLGIPAIVQGMSNWNQRRQGQNRLRAQGQGNFTTSFDDPTTAYDSANNIHKNITHIKIRRTL